MAMLTSKASMSPVFRVTGPARSGLTSPVQVAWFLVQSKLVLTATFFTSRRDRSLLEIGRNQVFCSSNMVFWLRSTNWFLTVMAYCQRLLGCALMTTLPSPCMPMAVAW